MMTYDFFKRKEPKNFTTEDARISEMRQEARALQEKNNNLAKKIWDIEFELTNQALDSEHRTQLTELKDTITKELNDEDYIGQINALLEKVQELEVDLYGHSEINGSSPYIL